MTAAGKRAASESKEEDWLADNGARSFQEVFFDFAYLYHRALTCRSL